MLSGKGAGQMAAASAVVADIIFLSKEIANGTAGRVPYVTNDPEKKPKVLDSSESFGSYYLRFVTADKPGVLSKISGILGKYGVSIASVYQEEPLAKLRRGVPIIMLTHKINLAGLEKALEAINELPIVKGKSVYFRIDI
jgi:homoserine dehydrogenase